jgi:hypothetical protein
MVAIDSGRGLETLMKKGNELGGWILWVLGLILLAGVTGLVADVFFAISEFIVSWLLVLAIAISPFALLCWLTWLIPRRYRQFKSALNETMAIFVKTWGTEDLNIALEFRSWEILKRIGHADPIAVFCDMNDSAKLSMIARACLELDVPPPFHRDSWQVVKRHLPMQEHPEYAVKIIDKHLSRTYKTSLDELANDDAHPLKLRWQRRMDYAQRAKSHASESNKASASRPEHKEISARTNSTQASLPTLNLATLTTTKATPSDGLVRCTCGNYIVQGPRVNGAPVICQACGQKRVIVSDKSHR